MHCHSSYAPHLVHTPRYNEEGFSSFDEGVRMTEADSPLVAAMLQLPKKVEANQVDSHDSLSLIIVIITLLQLYSTRGRTGH